ncbi:MAG TPA: galactose-1-phosphate uridylyltransferase [Acidobacteriota bacterium]|nr:galactose-1-phosphate uridylyltransferase [Acidobacteriota bacterium]
MHKQNLKKPDGRSLILYSKQPFEFSDTVPVPKGTDVNPNPHLRWHPLRGEWVAYATYRQDRTFLPPPEYNPLAPTTDPENPTELPQGDYEVAVFENRFPTLSLNAHDPPELSVTTLPATGVCEVVVYTQRQDTSLAQLPLWHVEMLLEVWADRYTELGNLDTIHYVMPFENRGVEVGVTLHHPHGQIYAYPFVPTIPARELKHQLEYWNLKKRGLLEDMIADELKDQNRLIYEGRDVVAFLPICARYSYEVWIAPVQKRPSLASLNESERKDFARALKTVLMKFDALWNRPFPYIMIFHQAPTDKLDHPEAHLHIEFYPPYRTSNKLKYLAGTEIGAGMFASDSLPEDKAAELRAVEVHIDT